MFKYVIVGAGFAGSVIAERIASQLNEKVLIIEKRNHIGGNAFDSYDKNGVLIHNYGPHIFHTKMKNVWDYLSNFTPWLHYHHEVLGVIDGKKVPIPFNLNSIDQIFPKELATKLEKKLISNFGYNKKVPILKLREVEDEDLRFLAEYIYEKVFLGYTLKQWGITPEELDSSVTGRVPVYISRDDRYFQDSYQGMPKEGYTKIFEKMLNHPNIKVMLNTDYKEVVDFDTKTGEVKLFGNEFEGKVIYTGPIDFFFDYKYGQLPYRSLDFKFESYNEEYVQEVGTVNYPNDYNFTRVTEFKHLTNQKLNVTTTVKEFSQDYIPEENTPYYPIKNDDNQELYHKYRKEAKMHDNLICIGRLAEYQYYDMDMVIARAIKIFNEKINK
ncbi:MULTISPECIES: UDP-galactopyranose mutase [Bacillus cereus group]|nr:MULTISPECIES: UDP-galactopyranose mutase [Bacillus cereus group]HDR7253086.1 UDP-galactopyranose mutase [Bacillus pacificus]MCC2399291.1 UDP-galactopyranose mutase [Bacillus paranthracis]MCU5122624.1 UDP-galactopyranose mutase [Bacillus paranthracis]MCU5368348.1 UDP-galactopyranose mutase [Bacillus paranthracis]MCU5606956.1 UDP-galactopyranose mutase [Bacillus paranthracis]